MAAAIPWVIGAGTVLGAASQVQQGKQQEAMANSEASQMESQAKNEFAASQIQAMEDRRQARLATSRAQAVGAASGVDPTSASFIKNTSDIEGQGELNALTSLWSGSDRARQLNNQAKATRVSGRQASKAANIGAMSTLLQSGGSLYSKYGSTPKAS